MAEIDYKFDVAFSFVKEDEGVATAINDLIQDRVSTFLYPKRQEDIAGTDGEEKFNKVFGEESRIVVVLYRENWGKTPWTRIEETAIRNRAYNEGYDFVIFIPLKKDIALPKWLPKTRLWVGLERWGIEGAASVIESRVQEAGGEPREESVKEHAVRLKRLMEAETNRKEFLNSEHGVNQATIEAERLFGLIDELAKQIGEDAGLKIQTTRFDRGIEICMEYRCMAIDRYYRYTNSLNDSYLSVQIWDGPPPRRGPRIFGESSKIREERYSFDRDYLGTMGWRASNKRELLTSESLASICLKSFMDYTQEEHLK